MHQQSVKFICIPAKKRRVNISISRSKHTFWTLKAKSRAPLKMSSSFSPTDVKGRLEILCKDAFVSRKAFTFGKQWALFSDVKQAI